MPTTIEERIFDNAEEFLRSISPNGDLFLRDRGTPLYFRGTGDATYGLIPAACRKENTTDLHRIAFGVEIEQRVRGTVATQVAAEVEVIWKFVNYSDNAGLPVPGMSVEAMESLESYRATIRYLLNNHHLHLAQNEPGFPVVNFPWDTQWPDKRLMPILALARHHGLPTRLLDWTKSSRVASYFAANSAVFGQSSNQKTHIAVWAINESRNPELSITNLHFVFSPLADNRNMFAQDGLFTVQKVFPSAMAHPFEPIDLAGLVAQQLEKRRQTVRLSKYLLPSSEAPKLLWLLEREGVSGSRLFPGYDGVAKSIREAPFLEPVD